MNGTCSKSVTDRSPLGRHPPMDLPGVLDRSIALGHGNVWLGEG